MTKRCAVYLRFSDEKQSPMSIEDQLRLCRGLVERNAWTIAAVYEEPAISAAHTMTRPRYRQMVTDTKTGRFDIIVAESLDRLNRRLEDTARLFNELKFVGASIVTVAEGTITEMHVSNIGLLAELTLKSISEKTRRGVEGRVLAGKSGGGRAFGYAMVVGAGPAGEPATGERKINEAEAGTVREIFRRFAAGEGPRSSSLASPSSARASSACVATTQASNRCTPSRAWIVTPASSRSIRLTPASSTTRACIVSSMRRT